LNLIAYRQSQAHGDETEEEARNKSVGRSGSHRKGRAAYR